MSVPWYLMAKGKGGGGYKTASGPIVSVNDALAAPLRALTLGIDPVQDLHGYDSPWPSGGGKNKFDPDSTGHEWVNTNNVISERPSAKSVRIPVTVGQTYSLSVKEPVSGNVIEICFLDSQDAVLRRYATPITTVRTCQNATAPENATTLLASVSTWATVSEVQLELGSTPTAYSPYSNLCPISGWTEANVWVKPTYDPTADPTATIQLGQTVYGGTLDVANGVLRVDRAMVDLGTLGWVRNASRQNFYAALSGSKGTPQQELETAICSAYHGGTYGQANGTNNRVNGAFCIASTTHIIYLNDERYADESDPLVFKAAVSGVQLVYELATPITIPLTPQEISTLAGQNVMWADCGDVTVEYLSAGGANPDLMKLAVAFMGR